MQRAGVKTQKRRRRENKTDYKKRINLLKGEKPRIVFRKTNRYIISQYVTSKEAQDKVEFTITSKELLRHGWPEKASGGLKSLTASYLTGFLTGIKIKKEKKNTSDVLKKETPIVDLGMIRTLHGTKVFAFIKGLIDAGVAIPCKKDAFPSEERLNGEHMKNKVNIKEIKMKLEKI
ncbi:MAG: 50S ribosomal protein L18 [Nanoarchaeota archaeon]|nr:50S ribosomal protein L18 [Nanoarchaeota archaeon]